MATSSMGGVRAASGKSTSSSNSRVIDPKVQQGPVGSPKQSSYGNGGSASGYGIGYTPGAPGSPSYSPSSNSKELTNSYNKQLSDLRGASGTDYPGVTEPSWMRPASEIGKPQEELPTEGGSYIGMPGGSGSANVAPGTYVPGYGIVGREERNRANRMSMGRGSAQAEAMRAEKAAKVTGYAQTQEALGLQKQLEDFAKIAKQIQGLSIDPKLVKAATTNLLSLMSGEGTHLNNPSFNAATQFVSDQMARRLSPQGYAPGEHSYGDNTIAQTIGSMTADWTKWWGDLNLNIVGEGNKLGQVGAQGALDAGRAATELNPYGLAVSSIATVGESALDPSGAFKWWNSQGLNLDDFKGLSGIFSE